MVERRRSRAEARPDGRRARAAAVTRDELEAAALRYLDRFDSSTSNLRRVLLGHLTRAAEQRGTAATNAERARVDALLARYQESGLLDDARFAGALARGLRRRGASSRIIGQKLRARGVPEEVVSQALADVDAELGPEAELQAARRFARRRRIGIFRPEAERRACYRKDLGALARAGFDLDVARRVLGAPPSDDDAF